MLLEGQLDRLHWMRQLGERRATQREAATALGMTVRQVQRLRDAFVELDVVRTRYPGFGPTLAHEKLVEGEVFTHRLVS